MWLNSSLLHRIKQDWWKSKWEFGPATSIKRGPALEMRSNRLEEVQNLHYWQQLGKHLSGSDTDLKNLLSSSSCPSLDLHSLLLLFPLQVLMMAPQTVVKVIQEAPWCALMQKTWPTSGVLWAGVRTVGRLGTLACTHKLPAIMTGLATTWQEVSFHGTISEAQKIKCFLHITYAKIVLFHNQLSCNLATISINLQGFWKFLTLYEYLIFAELVGREFYRHKSTAKVSNKSRY